MLEIVGNKTTIKQPLPLTDTSHITQSWSHLEEFFELLSNSKKPKIRYFLLWLRQSKNHFIRFPIGPTTKNFYRSRLNEHLKREFFIEKEFRIAVKNTLTIISSARN